MQKLVDVRNDQMDEGVAIVSTAHPQITAFSALHNHSQTNGEASQTAFEKFHTGISNKLTRDDVLKIFTKQKRLSANKLQ